MYKLIFLLIFFISASFSQDIFLLSKYKENILIDNYQSTYISSNNHLSPIDINQSLYTKKEKSVFGRTKDTIYSKLIIYNDTDSDKEVILVNPRVGIDYLDVWVYNNDILIKKQELGDMRNINNRELVSRYSAIEINVLKNQKYIIYSKIYSTTNGVLEANYLLTNLKSFNEYHTKDMTWWGLYGGMLLALIFYNFILFVIIKDKVFLIHTNYAIMSLITYFALYEIFYYLDFTNNYLLLNHLSYVGVYISTILQILLPLYFFKVSKNNYKFLYRIYIAYIYILSLMLLFYLLDLFDDYIIRTNLITYIPLLGLFIIFFASIYFVIKKENGAIFYMIAKIILIIGMVFTSYIIYDGFKNNIYIASIVTSILIILEIFFITLALSTKVKLIKQENSDLQLIANLQNKYTQLGQYLTTIVHQWRKPLGALGAVVANMEHNIYIDNISKSEIKENIEDLKIITQNFNEITQQIYKYISNEEYKRVSNLKSLIYHNLNHFRKSNISVEYEFINCNQDIQLYEATFSQLMIILISNSFNIFEKRCIENPKIIFEYKKTTDGFILSMSDNGGGISKNIIQDLFKPFKTTTDGFGIGLYMAKQIVDIKFNGKIEVNNIKNGAIFNIFIPNNSTK